MPEIAFEVDQSKSMTEQAVPGHNRWHPDIPAAASVRTPRPRPTCSRSGTGASRP